jgi:hypothetical protein
MIMTEEERSSEMKRFEIFINAMDQTDGFSSIELLDKHCIYHKAFVIILKKKAVIKVF